MNACSRVFVGDIYGDHDVLCAGIIGIKHRHNVVRDALVDICYRSGILVGKEVDIGLDGGCDKQLRSADMLLYSWDRGLDVCVDLTGSSPLTQTGMADFILGRAMIDVAQDIGARAAVHIFNRISFAIAKGVGAQILEILVGKEVDIGLDNRCDKPLCPTYMLLYSWHRGLDVCMDMIGSLFFMQTGMADFMPGRVVTDVACYNTPILTYSSES
ncbi:hypothetical protein Tco_1272610 [Tanacetum coccineum]